MSFPPATPSDTYAGWAATGGVTYPGDAKRDGTGFVHERLPFQWANHLVRNIYDWINYLILYVSSGAPTVTQNSAIELTALSNAVAIDTGSARLMTAHAGGRFTTGSFNDRPLILSVGEHAVARVSDDYGLTWSGVSVAGGITSDLFSAVYISGWPAIVFGGVNGVIQYWNGSVCSVMGVAGGYTGVWNALLTDGAKIVAVGTAPVAIQVQTGPLNTNAFVAATNPPNATALFCGDFVYDGTTNWLMVWGTASSGAGLWMSSDYGTSWTQSSLFSGTCYGACYSLAHQQFYFSHGTTITSNSAVDGSGSAGPVGYAGGTIANVQATDFSVIVTDADNGTYKSELLACNGLGFNRRPAFGAHANRQNTAVIQMPYSWGNINGAQCVALSGDSGVTGRVWRATWSRP